jgi:site-specific recombinase XerD
VYKRLGRILSEGGCCRSCSTSAPSRGGAAGDIAVNLASFTRALAATNLSPRTILSYTESTQLLARFLAERGMPTAVALIRREQLEAFVASLLAKWKPATAHNRYRP